MNSTMEGLRGKGIVAGGGRPLLIIIVVAAILRFTFAAMADSPIDGATLQPLARTNTSEHGITQGAPLYRLFIRIATELFGQSGVMADIVIQGLMSIAAVSLIYAITLRVQDRRTAIVAAAIAALYPNFILYNLTLEPRATFVFLFAALIAFLAAAFDMKRIAVITALGSACGVMLDPSLILIVPGMLFVNKKRLLYIAVFVAALAPCTIVNSVVAEKPVLVYGGAVYRDSFSIQRYMKHDGCWEAADSIYRNLSALLMKSWEDNKSPTVNDRSKPLTLVHSIEIQKESGAASIMPAVVKSARRNAGYMTGYSYVVIMVMGILGFLKYCQRDHRVFMVPIVVFIWLVLFLGVATVNHRAMIEPVLIVYASLLIGRIPSLFGKKVALAWDERPRNELLGSEDCPGKRSGPIRPESDSKPGSIPGGQVILLGEPDWKEASGN